MCVNIKEASSAAIPKSGAGEPDTGCFSSGWMYQTGSAEHRSYVTVLPGTASARKPGQT
jgi:hypothetical protein